MKKWFMACCSIKSAEILRICLKLLGEGDIFPKHLVTLTDRGAQQNFMAHHRLLKIFFDPSCYMHVSDQVFWISHTDYCRSHADDLHQCN